MTKSDPKVEMSSTSDEDTFWLNTAQALISESIDTLDERAKFMITTSASLLTADFAVLLLSSKFTILNVSPQLFFSLSTLFFVISLFPKHYKINPWQPDTTRLIYYKIINQKRNWHILGFSFLIFALLLIVISSIVVIC